MTYSNTTPNLNQSQEPRPLEKQWINVSTGDGWQEVEAIVIGQFGIHPIVDEDWSDVWTVTHVDTGCRFADFSDLLIALKFTNEVCDLCNYTELAQRKLAGTQTADDRQVIEYIWRRRLHVSYIPSFASLKKIRKLAPEWLVNRQDERCVSSNTAKALTIAPIVARANGGNHG